MRFLVLPVVLLTLAGSGAAAPALVGPQQIVRLSGQVTEMAGTARFAVSYAGSVIESGAVNLRNETAVLDRHEIVGSAGYYQRISAQEADVLGIAGKRWVKTDTHVPLLGDPFIPDLNAFFKLLDRANEVRLVGNGKERGIPVQHYSASLGIEAFLAVNPRSLLEQNTKFGKPDVMQMRDYFGNYFVWDQGGQALRLAVDLHGRIRRADLALPVEPLTVQLFDYGVGVDVSPPPNAQVITSTEYESLKTEYCSNPKRQIRPRKAPCQ